MTAVLAGLHAPAPFDPTRPVAEGVTVLEASAGTGKTHTVASLVVTEVAAGRSLEDLLVVTFTRKATGTLRERVWRRLASAAAALDPAAPDDPGDAVLTHLRSGPPEEVEGRRDRLARAVAEFDGATIATTHGFCQQVLASLGVAGDAERDLELVEDVDGLIEDAVDDLFVRRFAATGQVLFPRDVARRIARAVVANPDAAIAPVDADSEEAKVRQRFAGTVRQRLADQKRRGRLVTYDDLLTRLADSLDDPTRGAMVADRLRRRYSMAVVDEFQDTDTVQWRILKAAFGAPPSRLVLVGDPKQAIYAFRGGDVHAYLEATRGATRLGLSESWRADQPLLDGLDAFFAGAWLGGPDIAHRPLHARPGAQERRLLGPGVGAPLTVRVLDRDRGQVARTPSGFAKKDSARAFFAEDVAGEAVRLLGSGATLVERDGAGNVAPGVERPLTAGDLAVLVRRHREADAIRRALHQRGVPAVVFGGAGVLASDAAEAWQVLLRALELPSAIGRVRLAATGPFFGWDAARLALAPDEALDAAAGRLHEWAGTLRTRGVAALLSRMEASEGLTARLLGEAGGERTLSDLRHVGELLHARHAAAPSSAAALGRWLGEQRASGANREAERRRVESDADAVAVHTIHGAKGLEFPVVLLPSLWEGPWTDDDEPPVFHDADGQRCIAVGGAGRLHTDQAAAAARELAQEELRLLYVAMTRARHRVVVWWATAGDAARSPFARVLLGRDDATGAVPDQLRRVPGEDSVRRAVEVLAASSGGAVAVEDAGGPDAVLPPAPAAARGTDHLDVSTFDRSLDHRWVRTSYSGLVAAAHEVAPPGEAATGPSEPDAATTADKPAIASPKAAADPLDAAVPLDPLPGGARVGTLVHDILERTDFTAADLRGALAGAAAEAGAHRLVEGHVDVLVDGLAAALRTPLGPLFGDRRLCDLPRADRLDELTFDLPLAGGDVPTGAVTMDAIAGHFDAALPGDDPVAGYAERLREPALATEVRGFLTGGIDLVARVGDRHIVVDYKTNRLGAPGDHLTSRHYRAEALTQAMHDAHYPLQAALYGVALHRYLRWRLAGYDPDRHLGGAAYLFLRGMVGADTPVVDGQRCGVFSWHPPSAFVTGLSDLLDRGLSP